MKQQNCQIKKERYSDFDVMSFLFNFAGRPPNKMAMSVYWGDYIGDSKQVTGGKKYWAYLKKEEKTRDRCIVERFQFHVVKICSNMFWFSADCQIKRTDMVQTTVMHRKERKIFYIITCCKWDMCRQYLHLYLRYKFRKMLRNSGYMFFSCDNYIYFF